MLLLLSACQGSSAAKGLQAIAAGSKHTCAIIEAGGVKCWGYNRYGRLGDGTTVDRLTPVDVVGLTSGVQALSTSTIGYPCAVTTQGGAKCWGALEFSQLDGGGLPADTPAPQEVDGLTGSVKSLSTGLDHACAMTTAGGVKCWGNNENGQLGNGTNTSSATPVDVAGL
jgi:alpha-tubulin suppressor-like RCC1 family protein